MEKAYQDQLAFHELQQESEKWLLQTSFRLMSHNSLNVSTMELTHRQIEKHRVSTCQCSLPANLHVVPPIYFLFLYWWNLMGSLSVHLLHFMSAPYLLNHLRTCNNCSSNEDDMQNVGFSNIGLRSRSHFEFKVQIAIVHACSISF